jgi:redox-regulated HSP33 family molecular chaperone
MGGRRGRVVWAALEVLGAELQIREIQPEGGLADMVCLFCGSDPWARSLEN